MNINIQYYYTPKSLEHQKKHAIYTQYNLTEYKKYIEY